MGQGIVPECHDGNGTHFREHVVETGPVEKRGDADVEEKANTVDKKEFQKLFLVTALVIAEREVLVRKEDNDERHARGTGVADIRGNAEDLDEGEEERKIHCRAYSPTHGEAEALGKVLTEKWVMP